jgi:hypothetical protein
MPWLHKRKSGILFGVGDDALTSLNGSLRDAFTMPMSSFAFRNGFAG